ncbi:hypothetical protein LHL20_00150 [Alteromonas sp. McT4-15]|nr:MULTISPECIES: hypothetical protein [unclassified Alteromonas]MCB4434646.1 hypothetical protein [Alteromonas sp. McT4-15]MEC8231383.1 hypothetical protein [Pseudomonadota bacterium]
MNENTDIAKHGISEAYKKDSKRRVMEKRGKVANSEKRHRADNENG